jgi:LacI family transcriptional regulator
MAERIRKAALELNYQPNFIARSLKSGKTNTIGLIVADISNPFFSNIARIIEDEAKKHGYIVIFGSSDESFEKSADLIDVFLNRQVDAFIIAPAAKTEQQIMRLKGLKVPFVLIDRYFPQIKTDTVITNNFEAAYQAVEHLVGSGRKRIAMVSYDLELAHLRERENGYAEALKNNKISPRAEWGIQASYHNLAEGVADGLRKLLYPIPKVDAVFFATNSLAVAGMKVINELKITVPNEVAIISFDESDAFDFFYAPVTYVQQSINDIGRQAVNIAIRRIEKGAGKYEKKIVDARLVVRASTGRKAVLV